MRKMTIASIILAVCVIVCGSAIADNGVSVRPENVVGKAGEHVEIQITCDFEPASIEALEGGLHILGGVPPDLGGPKSIPVLGLHPLALSTLKPEVLLGKPEMIDPYPPFFIKGRIYKRIMKITGYRKDIFYLKTPAEMYELIQAKDYIGKPISSYVWQEVGVYSCRYPLGYWPKSRYISVNAITPYDATQQEYIGMLSKVYMGGWNPTESQGWYLGKLRLFGPENFGDIIANVMNENIGKRVKINGPVYKDGKVEQLLLMSIRPEPYKSTIVIGLTEGLIAVEELVLRIVDKQGPVHEIRVPVELPQKLGEKN